MRSQPATTPSANILVANVTHCAFHNRAEQPHSVIVSVHRVYNLDQSILYLLHVHGQVPLAPVPDLQTEGAPRSVMCRW